MARTIEVVKAGRGSRPASGYGYPGYYGSGMRLEVAKVAEKSRPRSALEIYRDHAEELIESRGRERYQEACRFLKKVKGLYEALGEPTAWANYVAALRERNRSLRALQEELTAAKL